LTAFGSAAQREFFEINRLLFCRAAKNLEFVTKNNSYSTDCALFCHAAQRNLLELPTKNNSKVNRILFCRAAKSLGIG
jgi:hypothetical protein